MYSILPNNSNLFLNARKAIYLSIAGLLLLAFVVPVNAMRPAGVNRLICGTNEGWADPPDVLILTGGAPTVLDDDAGPDVTAITLVRDAISEYWNGGANVDGEVDGTAGSAFAAFGGFASVSEAGDGVSDVIIRFVDLPSGTLGQASCTVDEFGNIISAEVELTDDGARLDDEGYKNVAAHELAHAIGLRNHSGPPGNLMFRALSGTDAYLPLSRSGQRTLTSLYGV